MCFSVLFLAILTGVGLTTNANFTWKCMWCYLMKVVLSSIMQLQRVLLLQLAIVIQ